MAVVGALQPIPNQGAHTREDLFSMALGRINDPGSADWQNLMGYSLRKIQPPDRAAA